MIIKRRFEIIGELIDRDERSKEIIMDELLKRYDQKEAERILLADYQVFMYLADIGSGIPRLDIIREKLEELDNEIPYDNGLTYADVSSVEILPSRQGKAAVLCMISSKYDSPKRIAQVIAVEYENGKTELIKPWSIDNVIF